jgi:hypothetical protein
VDIRILAEFFGRLVIVDRTVVLLPGSDDQPVAPQAHVARVKGGLAAPDRLQLGCLLARSRAAAGG